SPRPTAAWSRASASASPTSRGARSPPRRTSSRTRASTCGCGTATGTPTHPRARSAGRSPAAARQPARRSRSSGPPVRNRAATTATTTARAAVGVDRATGADPATASTRPARATGTDPVAAAGRAVLTAAAVGAAGLGWALAEAHAYTLRRATVPVLAPGQRPLRVLHISDLHLTPDQDRKVEWVRSLAELEPHLVVNTGDNMAHRDVLPTLLHALDPLLGIPGAFVMGSN